MLKGASIFFVCAFLSFGADPPKDDDARLDAVVAAYKHAFHQHSVGVIVRPACVAF